MITIKDAELQTNDCPPPSQCCSREIGNQEREKTRGVAAHSCCELPQRQQYSRRGWIRKFDQVNVETSLNKRVTAWRQIEFQLDRSKINVDALTRWRLNLHLVEQHVLISLDGLVGFPWCWSSVNFDQRVEATGEYRVHMFASRGPERQLIWIGSERSLFSF